MSRVLRAFCEASGTPYEDIPTVKEPSRSLPRHEWSEAHRKLEYDRGQCALNWLRVHAADWLTLAGVSGSIDQELLDGKDEAVRERTQALFDVPLVSSEGEPVDVFAAWDALAPIRVGMDAAARAAGLSPDWLIDLTRLGAQLAAKRSRVIDPDMARILPEALSAAAHAAVYEMATGEQPIPPTDVNPEFDVTHG